LHGRKRLIMGIAATVARILLGLLFVFAGGVGFFFLNNPPPAPPGLAETFQDVFFKSRWVTLVDGVQIIAGVFLLANRFVPVALILLAAVIANILTYHITMYPSGIVPGLVALVLWFVVSLRYRSVFAPIFHHRARTDF
jgi:putative oxidoreductase